MARVKRCIDCGDIDVKRDGRCGSCYNAARRAYYRKAQASWRAGHRKALKESLPPKGTLAYHEAQKRRAAAEAPAD